MSSPRIVLEKPVGSNLASAQLLNNQVGEVFPEEQIFRIDHYLGKETVHILLNQEQVPLDVYWAP